MEDLNKDEIKRLLDVNYLLTTILDKFERVVGDNETLGEGMNSLDSKMADNINEVNLNSKRIKELERATRELNQAAEGINARLDKISEQMQALAKGVSKLIEAQENKPSNEKKQISEETEEFLAPKSTLNETRTGVVRKRK